MESEKEAAESSQSDAEKKLKEALASIERLEAENKAAVEQADVLKAELETTKKATPVPAAAKEEAPAIETVA